MIPVGGRGVRIGPHRLEHLILACSLFAFVPPVRAQHVADERRIKAAFVYQFPQFVEWPTAASDGRPNVELCVTGPSSSLEALREIVRGETVSGKPLTVREIGGDDDIDTCHVLFVQRWSTISTDLLERASGLPILTVGESPKFLDEGGMVRFRVVERRVRFDINLAAASRVGLKLSSQLLRIAADVRGEPK